MLPRAAQAQRHRLGRKCSSWTRSGLPAATGHLAAYPDLFIPLPCWPADKAVCSGAVRPRIIESTGTRHADSAPCFSTRIRSARDPHDPAQLSQGDHDVRCLADRGAFAAARMRWPSISSEGAFRLVGFPSGRDHRPCRFRSGTCCRVVFITFGLTERDGTTITVGTCAEQWPIVMAGLIATGNCLAGRAFAGW